MTAFFHKVGKDPVEWIGTFLDAPIQIVARLIEKAPFEDWKTLYRIYSKNPELLKRVARANKKLLFNYYSIVGDTEKLKQSIDTFLESSYIFDNIRHFFAALRDEEAEVKKVADKPKKEETKSEL